MEIKIWRNRDIKTLLAMKEVRRRYEYIKTENRYNSQGMKIRLKNE